MRLRTLIAPLAFVALAACSSADSDHGGEEGSVLRVASALPANATVADAVAEQSCSTTSVRALSEQLVHEIDCLSPGALKSIAGNAGLSLGGAVFGFLQAPAAAALVRAQAKRGSVMTINSALRTLPQQYLLYTWYQRGLCGIPAAAKPGSSNHESGLAVDIEDNAGWRTAMEAAGFRWLGAGDPVHFDYVGSGTVDLLGLSVRAFQKLWNKNHPNDLIAEDGQYGSETGARLNKTPVAGFAIGTTCSAPSDAGLKDGGAKPPTDGGARDAGAHDAAAADGAARTDGAPSERDAETAGPGPAPQSGSAGPADATADALFPCCKPVDGATSDGGGCHVAPGARSRAPLALLAVAVSGLLLVRRRRR